MDHLSNFTRIKEREIKPKNKNHETQIPEANGFALGTTSAGDLWLQNEHGVILRLKAKREGLMLSLGGDAVVISMKQ